MSVKLRTKILKDGGKSYYLDIYHNGKRSYEFLGIKTVNKGEQKDSAIQKNEKKRIAESLAAQKEIELISKGTQYTPIHIKSMNFFDFADNFIERYSKKDERMILSALKKFREYIQNDTLNLIDISPELMEGFKEHLLQDPLLSGETPNNYWTRFKKILRSAKVKGLISSMPTDEIRFSNPNKGDTLNKDILEIEELRILAKTRCGNDEVKRAFLFCCYTGLGLAEIRALKWSNIRNGRLVMPREKTKVRMDNPLNSAALRLIGDPGKPNEYIFEMRPISHVAVNKNLKNWVKRAGIDKKITFYCGRHSYACLLLMNGANLKTVADAMGQKSTKNTIRYLNHVEKLKDEAINNIPDIEI